MNAIYKVPSIALAGSRITCARCQAKAKRTGEQCKKPALRGRKVCQLHGGRSFGPRTPEGRANSAAANYKTGEFGKASILKADRSRALLRVLEDAAHLLGMVPTNTPRTRGRPAKLYEPVHSPEDILSAILQLQDGQD